MSSETQNLIDWFSDWQVALVVSIKLSSIDQIQHKFLYG